MAVCQTFVAGSPDICKEAGGRKREREVVEGAGGGGAHEQQLSLDELEHLSCSLRPERERRRLGCLDV